MRVSRHRHGKSTLKMAAVKIQFYDDMGTEALDDQMLEGTEGGPVDDGTMDDGTMDEGAADATGSGDAEVQ